MTTKSQFANAYFGSYYTIIGAGGDPQDWINGYNNAIQKSLDPYFDITQEDVLVFSGAEMNSLLNLTDKNRYSDDLTFISFSFNTCHQIGKLAFFKMQNGDRWFDDIVANDLDCEGLTPDDIFNA